MNRTSRIQKQPMPVWSSGLPYWTKTQPRRTHRRTASTLGKLRAIRASRAGRRQRATPGS
jgi:hypothetical protein